MDETRQSPQDERDDAVTVREHRAGATVFGRYELKRILGRGGMGVVWLAWDGQLEREVALKFLPDVVAYNRGAVEELKRETKRALELTHPHLVRIYDFLRAEEHAGISMEYVDGDTLANLRVDRPGRAFEVREIRDWVKQLCEALDYAHNKGRVVHRDLKPANLMVNRQGDLKVADFGIARSLSDSVSRMTQGRHMTSGTLAYMSPQQLDGDLPCVSDDIYALGATLYELLTGKPPFFSGKIDLQIREKIPPPVDFRRRELDVEGKEPVPPEWEAAIQACLAKAECDRPQSAREVAERLGLIEVPVAPVPKTKKLPQPPSVSVAPPARRRPIPQWAWGAAGGIALLLLAGWLVRDVVLPAWEARKERTRRQQEEQRTQQEAGKQRQAREREQLAKEVSEAIIALRNQVRGNGRFDDECYKQAVQLLSSLQPGPAAAEALRQATNFVRGAVAEDQFVKFLLAKVETSQERDARLAREEAEQEWTRLSNRVHQAMERGDLDGARQLADNAAPSLKVRPDYQAVEQRLAATLQMKNELDGRLRGTSMAAVREWLGRYPQHPGSNMYAQALTNAHAQANRLVDRWDEAQRLEKQGDLAGAGAICDEILRSGAYEDVGLLQRRVKAASQERERLTERANRIAGLTNRVGQALENRAWVELEGYLGQFRSETNQAGGTGEAPAVVQEADRKLQGYLRVRNHLSGTQQANVAAYRKPVEEDIRVLANQPRALPALAEAKAFFKDLGDASTVEELTVAEIEANLAACDKAWADGKRDEARRFLQEARRAAAGPPPPRPTAQVKVLQQSRRLDALEANDRLLAAWKQKDMPLVKSNLVNLQRLPDYAAAVDTNQVEQIDIGCRAFDEAVRLTQGVEALANRREFDQAKQALTRAEAIYRQLGLEREAQAASQALARVNQQASSQATTQQQQQQQQRVLDDIDREFAGLSRLKSLSRENRQVLLARLDALDRQHAPLFQNSDQLQSRLNALRQRIKELPERTAEDRGGGGMR